MNTDYIKSLLNRKGKVYLAGGWFSDEQMERLEAVKSIILESGFELFSPKDEALVDSSSTANWRQAVVDGNLKAIKSASFMVAITNCKDMGTLHETGIACAWDIPIIYFAENLDGPFNVMLAQSAVAVATSRDQLKSHLNNEALLTNILVNTKNPEAYEGSVE